MCYNFRWVRTCRVSLLTRLRVTLCRETTITWPSPSAKCVCFKSGREKFVAPLHEGWKDSALRKRCAGKIGGVAGVGRWSGTSCGEYDKSRENPAATAGGQDICQRLKSAARWNCHGKMRVQQTENVLSQNFTLKIDEHKAA